MHGVPSAFSKIGERLVDDCPARPGARQLRGVVQVVEGPAEVEDPEDDEEEQRDDERELDDRRASLAGALARSDPLTVI